MAVTITEFKAITEDYLKKVKQLEKELGNLSDAEKKSAKTGEKAFDDTTKSVDDTTQSTKKLGTSLDGIGKKALQIGTRLVAAFAIQQVISRVTTTIIDFQKAMSELQAITGATGDDLDFLRQRAIELGRTSTSSAEEVVRGFQLIASARPELLRDGEALAFVTEQAIILADAANTDLEPAAIALTDALAQFNAPASEAGRFINVLAAAAQEGSVLIPDLTTALGEFGTVARSSNVSVEQSAALVEILGERIKGASRVGIQLRNIFTILQDGADDTNPAVVGLNTAIANLGDQVEQGASLTKRFGRENQIAAQLLIENQDRLVELTAAVTGTGTAFEQAEVNTDNFASAQIKAGNAVDSLILTFEDGTGVLSQFAQAIVESFTETVNQVAALNMEINDFSDVVGFFSKATSLLVDGIDETNNPLEKLRLLTIDAARATKEELTEAIRLQVAVLKEASLEGDKNSETVLLQKERLEELSKAYLELSRPTADTTEALEEQTEIVEEEVNSIGALQKKLSELNAELKRAEIGSKEFNDLQVQIRDVSQQVATATGKETEAAKKLREEREKAQKDTIKQFELDAKLFDQRQKENEDALKRDAEAGIRLQEIRATDFQEQQKAIIAQRDLELQNLKLTENERILIKEEANKKILELNDELREKEDEEEKEANDKQKQRQQEAIDATVQSLNAVADFARSLNEARTQREITELDERREAALENENLTEEERQLIQEQFEEERKEILREQAVQDKALAIFQATVNGAAAIIAQLTVPGAGPALAIAAGIAAALNLATIIATPIPTFHSGGVDIGNANDEFDAKLQKGETVTTRRRTKQYKPELQAIHEGKLEDYINQHYVNPEIKKVLLEIEDTRDKSFAENMMNSLSLNPIMRESEEMKRYMKRTYSFYKRMEEESNKPVRKPNFRHGRHI